MEPLQQRGEEWGLISIQVEVDAENGTSLIESPKSHTLELRQQFLVGLVERHGQRSAQRHIVWDNCIIAT